MSRRVTGWAFVAAQVVLLVGLALLPGADHWPTPGWLRAIASALVLLGVVIVAVASLRLGRALTPTPVPRDDAHLTTSGLYGFVRHPIYTGVLVLVAGIALRSGNLLTLAVAVATYVFFDRKAAWEEEQLAERYPDYREYARHTPRFFPRP